MLTRVLAYLVILACLHAPVAGVWTSVNIEAPTALDGSMNVGANLLDIDFDGQLDVIYTTGFAPYPYTFSPTEGMKLMNVELGTVDLNFATSSGTPAIVGLIDNIDLDGDGNNDLLYIGHNGLSSFSVAWTLLKKSRLESTRVTGRLGVPVSSICVAIEDFNNNGKRDMVFQDGEYITVLMDFENSYTFDQAMLHPPSTVSTFGFQYQYPGCLGCSPGFAMSINSGAPPVKLADVDGVRPLDWLVVTDEGYYSWIQANGGVYALQPVVLSTTPTYYTGTDYIGRFLHTTADIDHDGVKDFLYHEENNINVNHEWQQIIYMRKGIYNGQFATARALVTRVDCGTLMWAVGDMDKDGRLDLVFISSGTVCVQGVSVAGIYVAFQAVDGSFPVHTKLMEWPFACNWAHDIQLGDVNNDGILDIIVTSTFHGIQKSYFGPILVSGCKLDNATLGNLVVSGGCDGLIGTACRVACAPAALPSTSDASFVGTCMAGAATLSFPSTPVCHYPQCPSLTAADLPHPSNLYTIGDCTQRDINSECTIGCDYTRAMPNYSKYAHSNGVCKVKPDGSGLAWQGFNLTCLLSCSPLTTAPSLNATLGTCGFAAYVGDRCRYDCDYSKCRNVTNLVYGVCTASADGLSASFIGQSINCCGPLPPPPPPPPPPTRAQAIVAATTGEASSAGSRAGTGIGVFILVVVLIVAIGLGAWVLYRRRAGQDISPRALRGACAATVARYKPGGKKNVNSAPSLSGTGTRSHSASHSASVSHSRSGEVSMSEVSGEAEGSEDLASASLESGGSDAVAFHHPPWMTPQ